MRSEASVVMLCTAGRGGMRAVVEGYRDGGLFTRQQVRWLVTHEEGSMLHRLRVAGRAYLAFLVMLVGRRVVLVHSHMAMRGSFWRKSVFNATARAFGVPVVAHLHGSEFKDFYWALPPARQRRVVHEFERCAAVLVLSESWAEFVRGIATRANVQVLPNYVTLPPSPNDHGDSAEVTGLFLGLVGERKGVYDLLPALTKAAVALPALSFVVGGNGEVELARARAVALGLGARVAFVGWLSGEAKRQALAAADFYVLPSHNEGLPMSILEAMSFGLPVVATRVGGIPELVRDGVDGLLVAPGDVEALATAIERVAGDAGLRARMGRSARARVAEHYCDSVVLPRLEALYAELRCGRGMMR